MPHPRILLMYLHEYSGHHQAALALAKAFHELDDKAECRLVDVLHYAHPILGRMIQRTYLGIVQKRPEVWEYLYDNPWVVRNTQSLRRAIHQSHSRKLQDLLEDFHPTSIVCTQAFPCGILSDYKATYGYPAPLYGVLTDYFPHSYWVLDHVDCYFVPTEEAAERLRENGVFEKNIVVTGIPVDFSEAPQLPKPSRQKPLVLVMGGSQGIGPIEKIVQDLDKLDVLFEVAVLTGENRRLFQALNAQRKNFKKTIKIHPYLKDLSALLREATILVSKAGGLTIAQALACRLPMIFFKSIPGQEAKNASFLLEHRAAVEAKSVREVSLYVGQLLQSPAKIEAMKKNMSLLRRPRAAADIAGTVLKKEVRR